MRWIMGLLALTAGVSAFAKSSEIPARRDFPVSPEINPCTDFYQYACAKVIDSFQLREDRSGHTFSFSDSSERLLEAKKKYFADLATAQPKAKREIMIKNYYSACMNEPGRTAEEKALVRETQEILSKISTRDAFQKLLAKNRIDSDESALGFYVVSNQDRPLYNDLVFQPTWTSLPEKSYYEKPEVVADLGKMVTKFFTVLGDPAAAAKAAVVVEFEKGLAKTTLSPVERRDVMAVRTGITKAELLKVYPHLALTGLLEQIPKHTHIRHINPKAMEFLNARFAEMSLEDLKTIYLYNSLYKVLDDGYPDFFKEKFDFEKKNFGGPNVRPARNERCTRLTMYRFTPELDSILWLKIFPGFPVQKIVDLAEKIRASIIASLKENQWLSKAARAEAITKTKTAMLQLVAPRNDEEWNFGPPADYSLDSPIHNAKLYSKLTNRKDLNELKGPISPKRWGMGPLTINAYYDEAYNKFVLPVGILQYPFFDVDGPMEVNLAAIGTVIGHELGHGIDDKGSLYDSKGVLRTWMSKDDLDGFKGRTKLLMDQFTKAGQNGELTLGENIGDLVGLTASYRAAFAGKKPTVELQKAFFTQYARAWCEVMRPKYAELRIKSNEHALGEARVNQQVRQQPGFREVFQCKDTDAMVLPAEKLVHIW